MALMVIPQPPSVLEGPEEFKEPPEVIITPSEPWPGPYYLDGGLRKVAPYHFTYNTYCKQRWRGKELLEIFATEFRDRPTEYYKDAIETGNVVVNGQKVPSVRTIIKNGDLISHTTHRHEPPITAQPIRIVHEDDDMIVINKPAGVPVHPAGRYNFNSVVEIMRAERGYEWNPMPCNRLDRLTSGIMFVGKHAKAAEALGAQIKSRTVRKEYIARVIGEFPEGDVVCNQPILQISPKLGLNRARASGKDARTVFRRLAYYPASPRQIKSPGEGRTEEEKLRDSRMEWKSKTGYSIVRCLPLTGRTHQIRVHLQYLGHPIANDPIYSNQRVFGPDLAMGDATGCDDEDIIARLSRMGKDQAADAMAYHEEMMVEYNKQKAEKLSGELCVVCKTPLYTDPGEHELVLYLHARKYASADGKWSYETELPAWALPPPDTLDVEGRTDEASEEDTLALADKFETLAIETGSNVIIDGKEVSLKPEHQASFMPG